MTFGAMDVAMKALAIGLSTYNALFWRCCAGFIMSAALYFGSGYLGLARISWPSRPALKLHLVRGSVTAVMAFTFFFGLARTPMAEAIGISFIAPLIALYLAYIMLGERIGRAAITASLLGLAGVMLIIMGKAGEDAFTADAKLGIASILLSACLYAWNLILQRQQAQIASPSEIALFQNAIVVLWCLPFFPFVGIGFSDLLMPSALWGWSWLALAILGGFLAILSVLALSWAYARAEAQALVPIEYSMFIWAALFGWLVFAEPVGIATIGGTILIVGGCLIAARGSVSEAKITPVTE
jgi:S-adenosylmethionine uptake transporter